MTRIPARFAALKREGRGAFIPFIEAWDPDASTSLELLRGMPTAGADLIEIGIPFTDPMADGPIVQAAGKRALKAGVTVRHVLALVREFRRDDDATPLCAEQDRRRHDPPLGGASFGAHLAGDGGCVRTAAMLCCRRSTAV